MRERFSYEINSYNLLFYTFGNKHLTKFFKWILFYTFGNKHFTKTFNYPIVIKNGKFFCMKNLTFAK